MNAHNITAVPTATLMHDMGVAARAASRELLTASTHAKQSALAAAAAAMREAVPAILAANARDLAAAREAGRPASFIDRLMLNEARIEGIAKSLEDIAALPDPVGSK
ncbi:MAG: gamma-glutamyl-phosphate reductase, partial [Hyphomicrobiaceae bacterium]